MKIITRKTLEKYSNAFLVDFAMVGMGLIFFGAPIAFYISIGSFYPTLLGFPLLGLLFVPGMRKWRNREVDAAQNGKIHVEVASLVEAEFIYRYKASYNLWHFDNGRKVVPRDLPPDSKVIGAKYYLITATTLNRKVEYIFPCDKYQLCQEFEDIYSNSTKK